MAKRLVLKPNGWPCSLEECPPGFFMLNESVHFKTEYRTESGEVEAYVGSSGEFFAGGVSSKQERADLEVQPVIYEWEDYEEW